VIVGYGGMKDRGEIKKDEAEGNEKVAGNLRLSRLTNFFC
jgi:hypothetical protein